MKNRVLSALLSHGFLEDEIRAVAVDPAPHYQTYYIKKKNGAIRELHAPDARMKQLLCVLTPFIKRPKVHKSCTGYERGCSPKQNALRHAKNDYVLHMDIKDFFHSVNKSMFIAAYEKYFSAEETELLWSLIQYREGLPIGSPVSPFVANRVMYACDKALNRLAFGVRYTRYADDLVFSCKKFIPNTLSLKAEAVLRGKTDCILNPKKTYHMHGRKTVTGVLLLEGGKLSLGTHYKKTLKSDIYRLLTKKQGNFKKIAGKIAYLNHIEPEYAKVLLKKYGANDAVGLFRIAGVKAD